MTDAVPGFNVTTFSHRGRTHEVFLVGAGPAVIVVHEMPGLTPGMIAFGQRLIDAGYRAYLPSLFGRRGAPFSGGALGRSMWHVCVSREFVLLADRTNPVASWLRALAAQAHAECGGPGVGAVGMCFTGGFALAMAVEPGHPTRAALDWVMAFLATAAVVTGAAYQTSPSRQSQVSSPQVSSGTASSNT